MTWKPPAPGAYTIQLSVKDEASPAWETFSAVAFEWTATCGDGVKQSSNGEACDDGNTQVRDGCSPLCQIELICGDGIVSSWEGCDDGNTVNGDGCSWLCQLE